MGVHPFKNHTCKIKCIWSIILWLLYSITSNINSAIISSGRVQKWTYVYMPVYRPPIVQILINLIICIYYLYIYIYIYMYKLEIQYISIYLSCPEPHSGEGRIWWRVGENPSLLENHVKCIFSHSTSLILPKQTDLQQQTDCHFKYGIHAPHFPDCQTWIICVVVHENLVA